MRGVFVCMSVGPCDEPEVIVGLDTFTPNINHPYVDQRKCTPENIRQEILRIRQL